MTLVSHLRVKKTLIGRLKLQKNSTEILVVAAALISDSGEILMQRRRQHGIHGGLWEFPGGKIEALESPEMALVREIEEEIGIRLDAFSLRPVSFASGTRDPKAPEEGLVILLYSCREWQGDVQCLDGDEIAWVAPGSIRDLEMPPLDYPLADALLAALQNNSI